MQGLNESILKYEKALSDLETALKQPTKVKNRCCESEVLQALIARDDVAAAVTSHQPVKGGTLSRIIELDRRLKGNATVVYRALGRFTFEDWRDTAHPPDHAWWWSLDKWGPDEDQRRNPFWAILSALFVTVTIVFITQIGQRFLGHVDNLQNLVSTVIALLVKLLGIILALVGGGSLTQTGQQWLEKLLSSIGIEHKFSAKQKTFLAGAMLLAALALGLLLPTIAPHYQKRGYTYQQQGDRLHAKRDYELALALNPDFAVAHYSLGTILEDYKQYDEAINQYDAAIKLSETFFQAYNNLAHLYLSKRSDYDTALGLVERGLELAPADDKNARYHLYKNRGWAHLGLKLYEFAEQDLTQAIALAQELGRGGAGAHCLRAYVLEAQNKPAYDDWYDCTVLASREDDVEPVWKSKAGQRMLEQYKKEAKEGGSK